MQILLINESTIKGDAYQVAASENSSQQTTT
jgi:hypothetical protein